MRLLSLVFLGWLASGAAARADEGPAPAGPSGYGASEPDYQYDVTDDGYGGVGRPTETADAPGYVVVETESGTTTEYEGEPILVVKEPEPVAATSIAPPSPRVLPSDEVVLECPSGVWVHGYWDYRGGRYVWVDGHCVELRVNYVFVAPRWDFYWDIWWFIPGYYRPCGAFVTFGYYRPWHWFPPYPYPYYRTGRPIAESRGVPVRGTVARPAPARTPSAAPVPRHRATVIDKPPSGATRSFALGRAGTGPVVSDQGIRSRHGVDIVTEPRSIPRYETGFGAPPPSRSRGIFRGRTRSGPSSGGLGSTPSTGSSSGSSRGWGSGSSSGRHGGDFGGKKK